MDMSNPDSILNHTQSIRLEMIETLRSKHMDNPDSFELLNKLLDSTDKAIFTKTKLTIDNINGQQQKLASQILTEVLTKLTVPELVSRPSNKEYIIEHELDDINIVKDEMATGQLESLSIDDLDESS